MNGRTVVHCLAGLVLATGVMTATGTSSASPAQQVSSSTLTNLAHLDYLTDAVAPPAQAGHSTYRIAQQPRVGVLWVYANHVPDGTYHRTGGGPYSASTNTYAQGAYDADDIARASVVYLRHWSQWGDTHSRDEAYQLLRGLTYLQTDQGPNAGNIVLWMQPDGALNPSPVPADTPNPSDSGASYWLARTIWALGEGYSDFHRSDPAFAVFLKQRLDLAIAALDREVLSRYGQMEMSNGLRVPAWLITGGADASSEAVLGLAAYTAAGGSAAARRALSELATGIADMGSSSSASGWPQGAILPSVASRSTWHAWAAQMPSALAAASEALHRRDLLRPALADTAVFTPHLLTASGPDNGLMPTAVDGSQIAYGADARVQALISVATAAGSQGLRSLAGVAAGWFFGQNPAGVPTYNPQTGATDDGVSANGTLNLNSGAESTIHGLLTMEALDSSPDIAAIAQRSSHILRRDGQTTVEAESGALGGTASVVQAVPAYTGEAQWSGGAYVQLPTGSTVKWTLLAAAQPRLLQAVVNRVPGQAGRSGFSAAGRTLGTVDYGGGGPQGISPTAGALLPITVPGVLPADATTLTATTRGGSGQLDALQITPLVSCLITQGGTHGTALLSNVASTPQRLTISVPGSGVTRAKSYDSTGRLWRTQSATGSLTVTVPANGFAIAQR